MDPLLLCARWALPVEAPPLADAALLIGPDGRIATVGPRGVVRATADCRVMDLGDAILVPGLVNVHTHLELTGFESSAPAASPHPPSDFAGWIRRIRERKETRSGGEYLEAARSGLRECWAGGVTTIADTGDSGAVLRALVELGGSGIAYQEVFGPHPAQLEESMSGLRDRMAELRPLAQGRARLGVSPHSAYTVSGPLFSAVAAWAREESLPLAVHAAESPAETELVTRGTGPFAEAWKQRGIPLLHDPLHAARVPRSPIAWLDALNVLGPATLCIHAIQVDNADLVLLERTGAAVACCPISNARHAHGQAPVRRLRRAGIRVGLGTDSVASTGRLDLFAEMRAARTLAGLTDEETLTLATLDGARALGLEREVGSLGPGKWGDVVVVRAGTADGSPAAQVVSASPDDVRLTVLGGRVVYSHSRYPIPPSPSTT